MIGIEEGEETQVKDFKIIFNKIIEENYPNLKKDPCTKVQEAYKTRVEPQRRIMKTLNVQNKERIKRGKGKKTKPHTAKLLHQQHCLLSLTELPLSTPIPYDTHSLNA